MGSGETFRTVSYLLASRLKDCTVGSSSHRYVYGSVSPLLPWRCRVRTTGRNPGSGGHTRVPGRCGVSESCPVVAAGHRPALRLDRDRDVAPATTGYCAHGALLCVERWSTLPRSSSHSVRLRLWGLGWGRRRTSNKRCPAVHKTRQDCTVQQRSHRRSFPGFGLDERQRQ